MKIVTVYSQYVDPFYENRFLIAVAKNDLVIKIPDNLSYEMRATSYHY